MDPDACIIIGIAEKAGRGLKLLREVIPPSLRIPQGIAEQAL
jgi:hypothetical protein